jgi:LmbE family N-acetylglucosaminyl deacetylase
MIRFALDRVPGPLTVLCIGAHADDIDIGCGGAILTLAARYPEIRFHWLVLSAAGVRKSEAACAAELFTPGNERSTVFKEFRDGYFPYAGADIKDVFEELKGEIAPDLIFTHTDADAHQDHRETSRLTRNTFRDHLILEYEIPKYDGDLGRPNVFFPLDQPVCDRKLGNLMQAFGSQRKRDWFAPETFLGLMRIRGMECRAPSGYAEAFYCRKVSL